MTGPDYILDIAGLSGPGIAPGRGGAAPADNAAAHAGRARPWLAIHWRCCSVYSRVYRNPQATAYEARCPRCAKAVSVRVGAGGTASRFFEAG